MGGGADLEGKIGIEGNGVLATLKRDIEAIFDRDPAAKHMAELILAYPGFHALLLHRVAHRLYRWGIPVIPRLVSHFTRFVTAIEIHPGAKIGPGCFIDHGMGVVIGETAEIGENVTIYQGVTLGAQHFGQARSMRGVKRHPTIGNNVLIGVGASVLGDIRVGDGAIVGAGAVVVKPVPDNTTVVGVPGHEIGVRDPQTGTSSRVINLPDPVAQVIKCLHEKVLELEARVAELEGKPPAESPSECGAELARLEDALRPDR